MKLRPENLLTPVDVCRRFQVSRTTLFRWEREGRISKTRRGRRGERIYSRHHLEQVAPLAQEQLRRETALLAQLNKNALLPDPKLYGRFHVASVLSSDPHQVRHGLQQLASMPLDDEIVRIVVEDALARPRNDESRRAVWRFMEKIEKD